MQVHAHRTVADGGRVVRVKWLHVKMTCTDGCSVVMLWHCYRMTYAEHYCLVPHPMAVLGRKRM
jgi:hypothetical protein